MVDRVERSCDLPPVDFNPHAVRYYIEVLKLKTPRLPVIIHTHVVYRTVRRQDRLVLGVHQGFNGIGRAGQHLFERLPQVETHRTPRIVDRVFSELFSLPPGEELVVPEKPQPEVFLKHLPLADVVDRSDLVNVEIPFSVIVPVVSGILLDGVSVFQEHEYFPGKLPAGMFRVSRNERRRVRGAGTAPYGIDGEDARIMRDRPQEAYRSRAEVYRIVGARDHAGVASAVD
ncbi:MAG: hypothetical protein BWY96_00122 [Spirochaetes bacterium ADurb.BinA120]|nr:MAG: hypothetical protein BWY96_00122 [Spirochaetes bacterium ADurb.BinA120]